jgi:hypothetical protein
MMHATRLRRPSGGRSITMTEAGVKTSAARYTTSAERHAAISHRSLDANRSDWTALDFISSATFAAGVYQPLQQ